ncbi:MAG: VanZ family protein [Acidobacteriaceae bacterium]|jgi:VanZ family protein
MMRPVFFYKPSFPSPRSNRDWRWWFKVWTPVVIAIAVICCESTAAMSSEHTSSFLRPFFERLFGPFQGRNWEIFHHALRKTGHFVGYGAVAFTFLRAWLHTLGRRGPMALLAWRVESSILAIFSTAIVASCDEFHQTFVPGRTGTPVDVLLDTAGAAALCLLVWLICWSRRTPETLEL